MPKGKKYPRGCTDLGRAFDYIDKEEKTRRKKEFLNSRREDKSGDKKLPDGEQLS